MEHSPFLSEVSFTLLSNISRLEGHVTNHSAKGVKLASSPAGRYAYGTAGTGSPGQAHGPRPRGRRAQRHVVTS